LEGGGGGRGRGSGGGGWGGEMLRGGAGKDAKGRSEGVIRSRGHPMQLHDALQQWLGIPRGSIENVGRREKMRNERRTNDLGEANRESMTCTRKKPLPCKHKIGSSSAITSAADSSV